MAENIVSRKRAWSEANENGEPSTEEERQNKRQAIIRDEPEQTTRGDLTVAVPGKVEASTGATTSTDTVNDAKAMAGKNDESVEDEFGDDPFEALPDEELEQLSQRTQVKEELEIAAVISGDGLNESGDDDEFGNLDDSIFDELSEEDLEQLSQGMVAKEEDKGTESTASETINNDDALGNATISDPGHDIVFEGLSQQTEVKRENGTTISRIGNEAAHSASKRFNGHVDNNGEPTGSYTNHRHGETRWTI